MRCGKWEACIYSEISAPLQGWLVGIIFQLCSSCNFSGIPCIVSCGWMCNMEEIPHRLCLFQGWAAPAQAVVLPFSVTCLHSDLSAHKSATCAWCHQSSARKAPCPGLAAWCSPCKGRLGQTQTEPAPCCREGIPGLRVQPSLWISEAGPHGSSRGGHWPCRQLL